MACGGSFLETYGTLVHGKRVPAERIVYVVASLAEGLGIRAVARVFAVDPNTVLQWLVETADHLTPQEGQIARLAADELTNREIAVYRQVPLRGAKSAQRVPTCVSLSQRIAWEIDS